LRNKSLRGVSFSAATIKKRRSEVTLVSYGTAKYH